MSLETRVAELERELAEERAERRRMAEALRVMCEAQAANARNSARRQRPQKVYFARGPTGNIKIGVSANPWARARDLQTGAGGGEVTILAAIDGGMDDERRLHERFAPARLVGEWFSPTPEILALVASVGGDVSGYVAATVAATPPPSFPSSFPPSSEPSSSYPLSFPPSPSSPPASQAAPVLALVGPVPSKPTKPRKPPTEPTDPRHRPLLKALEAIGFPIRGGIDGKAVSNLLALADRLGPLEAAPAEVLRRARIGWAWAGFPACKSLTELHANWGHYARAPPGGAATSIPKANDPGWVTS